MRQLKLITRESSTDLDIREAVTRPQSFNPTLMTVEAVIASATPVQRQDARGSYLEILDPAGLDLAGSRGSSILDSHQQAGIDNILGVLDAVRIEGDSVIGTIRLTSRPEKAATIGDIRSGIISNMSAGYRVDKWKDGTDAQGNRTRTATKWTIHEASFVSVPADRNARTRNTDRSSETNRIISDMARRAGVDPAPLIARGATVKEARNDILFELQVRSAVPLSAHNRQSMDDPANRAAAMGEALYCRVMPSHRPSAAAQPFVGMRIPDLARECCTRAGVNLTGVHGVTLIERALHTTTDFPLILADVVNRTLRQSYDAATSAVKKLGRETTAPDFRKKHRLMLDSSGMTLEKVSEDGEFRYSSMSEAEETYALDSYGTIFGISRKALVNDDLGAFTDMTRRLGAACANFEARFLVDLLTSNAGLGPKMEDGATLFDATHGNVSAAGAAPSDTTLSAARLAMRRQTGPSGGLIVVEPLNLLVPPELETSCEKLLTEIRPVIIDNVNIWSKLQLVVEPRLSDKTRWYLTADPNRIDGLEYATLAGMPGPQVESRVGFEVDGVQVKVREDFGAGFVDWRGWATNAGA